MNVRRRRELDRFDGCVCAGQPSLNMARACARASLCNLGIDTILWPVGNDLDIYSLLYVTFAHFRRHLRIASLILFLMFNVWSFMCYVANSSLVLTTFDVVSLWQGSNLSDVDVLDANLDNCNLFSLIEFPVCPRTPLNCWIINVAVKIIGTLSYTYIQ